MSDYAPPPGPPPPKVPEGWKAVWNDQYKEWFYVNLNTKESTWEKPTAPAPGAHDSQIEQGLPSYSAGPNAPTVSDTKKPLESNNPYAHETDEQMARRLQAEEDSHRQSGQSHGHGQEQDRGAADSYYNQSFASGGQQPPGIQGGYPGGPQSSTSPYPQQQQYPQQPQQTASGGDKGLLGKLKNKFGGGLGSRPQGYPSHGGGYGSGMGGYPQQQPYGGGYGGYPQQQAMYAQQPMKKKHGLGAGGAAALGVGGGLVGGMLLADAIDDHDEHEYDQGYQDGMNDDFGGGDDFGGDF